MQWRMIVAILRDRDHPVGGIALLGPLVEFGGGVGCGAGVTTACEAEGGERAVGRKTGGVVDVAAARFERGIFAC